METLEEILISRDGLSRAEARERIKEARERVLEGEDPEEILLEDFGLESDCLFDLLGF